MSTNYRPLSGQKIALAVTGGIAAYKAVDLMRELQRRGADVHVIMTANARRFVTPLTFSVLSGHPVMMDVFPGDNFTSIDHITLAEKLNLLLVAPATANCLAKFATGIADDFLSTFHLSTTAPLLLAPAMNWKMYQHQAVQENLRVLMQRGATVVEPEEGDLACRDVGKGRLASLDTIVDTVIQVLTPKTLSGRTVLVTAGPTREHWDAFRYLSNPSSGKMGFALARAARNMGGHVTLITGPTGLKPPMNVHTIPVVSAGEMFHAVIDNAADKDVIIMAAAVSDFRPRQRLQAKIKKAEGIPPLELVLNPDILSALAEKKSKTVLVGFAAETDNVLNYARKKMIEKGIDMIVANQIGESPLTGFGSDTNACIVIHKSGAEEEIPLAEKEDVAMAILERIEAILPDNR